MFSLMVMSSQQNRYHFGQTQDGKDFKGFLGKEIFNNGTGLTYDEFLHQAFSMCQQNWFVDQLLTFPCLAKKMCEKLAMGPEDEENLRKAWAEDPGSASESKPENEPKETKAKETAPQMSEYKKVKLHNITENRALMEKLGLGGSTKEIFKGESKGKGGLKKKASTQKPTSTCQQ